MNQMRLLKAHNQSNNNLLNIFRGYCQTASGDKTPNKSKDSKRSLLNKTPLGKLDEFEGKHPYQEKEPLPDFEDGVNPKTGEVGGPKGPEPTRYGDWERKGRVSDF